ncbi:MAG: hypothetical protein IT258_13660, partial [Saprospiraceae bacterium]|nr:hypothetical protein [Saprospiraceae bacterium]
SLSIAEILLLAARLELNEIVEDRLDYLAATEAGKPDHKWGEQYEFVQQLNQLRPRVGELSGSEILTLLLEELDLRRIIVAWGNVEQRLSNVDMLMHYALHYEQACNRLNSAASLGGFLLWANDLAQNENDLQGSGENPLAVNVLTYHKSKGLEYPVVICASLEQSLKEDVWGISLVPEAETFDLDNLLGNRWLRLWVNPYADQFKGTILESRVDESVEKAEKRSSALAEEIRLLYVGLTRARDYLVFPTREKAPIWLNRVCNNGQEEQPALDINSEESLWTWHEKDLLMDKSIGYFGSDFAHTVIQENEGMQLAPREGRVESHPVYKFDADIQSGGPNPNLGAPIQCYSPFNLPELPERQLVATAFRDYLMAVANKALSIENEPIAKVLIENYQVSDFVEAAVFLEKGELLLQWMAEQFGAGQVKCKFPVRSKIGGQVYENSLDMVVESATGHYLLHLVRFIGDSKQRQRKLKSMAADIRSSKMVYEKAMGLRGVKVWVLFLLYGEAMELSA